MQHITAWSNSKLIYLYNFKFFHFHQNQPPFQDKTSLLKSKLPASHTIIQCLTFILIILNFNLKIFIILDDSDMYAFLNRKELLSVTYYLHSQAKIQKKYV